MPNRKRKHIDHNHSRQPISANLGRLRSFYANIFIIRTFSLLIDICTHIIIFSVLLADELMILDKSDKKLLSALQENNRLTSAQLSEIAGLSPTACQRRVAKLRDEGIIEGDVSIVSPKAVGRAVQMLVLVSLERERADIIDRFKRTLKTTPEVMSAYYITGESDFALVVTARDMDEYDDFTRRFFHENQDIKSFKTLVVISRVKSGFTVPLDE